MLPASVRPSQLTSSGRNGFAGAFATRRRTSPPSRSTTLTVTSSASFTATWMSLRSRTPSPLGEKNFVILVTRTTGGAPFRRWAAKNAENVAPTSTMKTTRAKSVTWCGSPSADLVLAQDDDDLGRPAGGERLRVDRLHLGGAQALGDVARGGARALLVVDDRGRPALRV